MMTNITFSLPEKTVKRLRRRAAEGGGRKGTISEMVDAALTTYLDAADSSAMGEVFTAKKGDEIVAQAKSLKALSDELGAKGIDWRRVIILSNRPLEPAGHLGLRVRPA